MFISQSLSIIASSFWCCLAVVSRWTLQHSILIWDWLCGLIFLLFVGIVVVVGRVWSQPTYYFKRSLLLWLCYVVVVVVVINGVIDLILSRFCS